MENLNSTIIREIADAAEKPEVDLQVTAIQFLSHHNVTEPHSGETIKISNIRIEFALTAINLRREDHPDMGITWQADNGADYTDAKWALNERIEELENRR